MLLDMMIFHCLVFKNKYCTHGIIGELNIWRFALKRHLARFLFGDFEYCMERNPCLQPKWRTFNLAIFT